MLVVDNLTAKNKLEWEHFTSTSEDATFFHTYDWEEVLRLGCENEATTYWGLWLRNELVAIWPSCILRAFGGRLLFSLPHSNTVVPAIKQGWDITLLSEVAARVVDETKKRGVLHWGLDVPESSSYIQILSLCGFKKEPSSNCTFSLDTTLDNGLLWQNLSKKARNAVRKAWKQQLVVREPTDQNEFLEYFAIYQSTMKRHHRSGLNRRFFDILYDRVIETGKAKVFLATDQNKIVAGIIMFIHNGKAYWWSGASRHDAWSNCPNELLVWHAINWASQSAIRSIDLGPTPTDPTSGLNIFKRQFGGQRVDLISMRLPVNRERDFLVTSLVETYRKFSGRGLVPGALVHWLQGNLTFD